MSKKAHFVLFGLIIFLAFIVRVAFIDISPPALYGDELTIVYDSYSLLKTGRDQLGYQSPLTFSMGAGRPAGYVYFSIPFVALFGPGTLGVRGLSILSGVFIVLLIYAISKKLFSRQTALLAAALTALSPWEIALSRGGFEAHFALSLALGGIYAFLKAQEKPFWYIISAALFGLTLHTYPTYKLTIWPFLILLFFIFKPNILKVKGKFLVSCAVFFVFVVSALTQTLAGTSEERFSRINIFSDQNLREQIIQKVNFQRSISALPEPAATLLHNKPLEYSKVLGENYLQNFSIDFLFLHGDRNPRHNIVTMGEFYLVEILLIFFGAAHLFIHNRRVFTFLALWLLIAPLATALIGPPHALRSVFMFPALLLISANGFDGIKNLLNKFGSRLLFFLILTGFAVQLIFFIQKLFFLAPKEYGNFWSYSAKVAAKIAAQERGNFDYIFISDKIDNIEFAYPVYNKVNPELVIKQNQKRESVEGIDFKKFDNIYIGSVPEEVDVFLKKFSGRTLFIGPSTLVKPTYAYETVDGLDGRRILILVKGQ